MDENTFLYAGFNLTKLNADSSWGDVYSGDSAAEAANITLQPGESINVYVTHGWLDADDSQPEVPQEGASINYNVTLGFEQITVQ